MPIQAPETAVKLFANFSSNYRNPLYRKLSLNGHDCKAIVFIKCQSAIGAQCACQTKLLEI
jgi:hypothetical protein